MRRARISSGGVRSRSSFFATGRGGCFDTRNVYYGVAGYATRCRLKVERVVLNALADECGCAAEYLRLRRIFRHRLQRSRSTFLHGGTRCPQRVGKQSDRVKRAANAAEVIVIAAADASTTQERRAAHPRPSRVQEQSCHLPGCYRVRIGDRHHWTAHR